MTPPRGEVYRGLLTAIGRYSFVDAHTDDWEDSVDLCTDHAYRTIIDWACDGRRVHVLAHHVWGVGQMEGHPRGTPAYDYVKDRHITWNPDTETWEVRETRKYSPNGADYNAPTSPDGTSRTWTVTLQG